MAYNIKVPKLQKIMFIDDDEYTIEHHKLLASEVNLAREVYAYTNASEALNFLAEIKDKYDFPELLIVDINMPEMDGHEFVDELTNMQGYNANRTVICFLTSSKDMTDVIKADENMVEFYHWKPLTKETLFNILRDGFSIEPGN